ncbi:hypothetical protein PAMA_010706 [Pampus argenteus]
MKLTDNVLRSFRVAKVFRENSDKINCFDFSSNGETIISSSDDDSLVLYDCQEGKPKRTLYSKKYGVDLIRYTHAANTVVYSSNKIDDTIRYLSLHDNKYIRYFPGHNKRVTSLSMSPVDDTFISGSLDKTIRLWDLRSPNCQGLMHLQGKPVCSFDPEGLIFAAGINSEMVKLYDLRSFDKVRSSCEREKTGILGRFVIYMEQNSHGPFCQQGPFATFKLQYDRTCEWTGLKFSNDGKLILLSTNGGALRILDAFKGAVLHSFGGYNNSKGVTLEASFTPDSQFVMIGSEDGKIHMWNAESGMKVALLDGKHTGPITCLQFNPKFMTFASACSNMAFWLPTIDD